MVSGYGATYQMKQPCVFGQLIRKSIFYSRHQTDQYIGIVSLTNKIAVDSNGRAYPSQYGMLAWTKAKSGIETRLFATEKSWDVVKLDMNLASLNIGEHRSFKEFRLAAKLFCRLCEIDNQYSFDATPEEPKSNKPHGFGSWS